MKDFLFWGTVPAVGKIIGASRRTEDIWGASYLIAYLIKKSLHSALANIPNYERKIDFIFPAKLVECSDSFFADIPNKIVLVFKESTSEEVKDFAESLKKSFEKELKTLADFTINQLNILSIDDKMLLLNQSLETVEFFWGAVELNNDYKECRAELESYLNYCKDSVVRFRPVQLKNAGSVIHIENFNDISYDQFLKSDFFIPYCKGSYTCTVCKEHGIIGATQNDFKGDSFWKNLWDTPRFKRGERLCGFCLIKRYLSTYVNKPSFPSTSEIANTGFKRKILENQDFAKKLLVIFDSILDRLPKGNQVSKLKDLMLNNSTDIKKLLSIDGEWFLINTWENKNQYKSYRFTEVEAEKIKTSLEKVYEEFKIYPFETYTILKLDGDDMGAKIAVLSKEQQQELSNLQLDFINKAKEIIYENYGEAVYLGGDDVFALIPVEQALKCAVELRSAFDEVMKPTKGWFNNSSESKYQFNLSGGLIYAHHLIPLRSVIDQLNSLEKKAKLNPGKNSLAVKFLKRSFSCSEAVLSWNKVDLLTREIMVPKGFIYKIGSLKATIEGLSLEMKEVLIKNFLQKSFSPDENNDKDGKKKKEKVEIILSYIKEIAPDLSIEKIVSFLKLKSELNF